MSEAIKNAAKEACMALYGYSTITKQAFAEAVSQALSALSAEPPEPVAEFTRMNKGGSGEFISVQWNLPLSSIPDYGRLYASPIAAPASQPTKELDDAIEEATERMWRVHPADLQDEGITRKQYYKREIAALVRSSQPNAAAIRRTALEEIKAKLKHRFLGYEDESVPLSTVFDCLDSLAQAPQEQQEQKSAAIDFSKPLETMDGDPVEYVSDIVIEYRHARVCVDPATGIVFSSPYHGLRIRNAAPTAQQAGQPAPAVPEGCVIVPIESTGKMDVAGMESLPDGCQQSDAERCYRAMINAAPAQEGEKK